MALPLILGVAAGVAAAATAGYKIYQSYFNDVISLNEFSLWGLPNSGKTTFIKRLLELKVDGEVKEQTTSKNVIEDIPIKEIDGKKYKIERIIDLPGTKDRLDCWIDNALKNKNSYFLINLCSLEDKNSSEYYMRLMSVFETLKKRVNDKSKELSKGSFKLNLIYTHIDKSESEFNAAQVTNELMDRDICRKVYEYFQEDIESIKDGKDGQSGEGSEGSEGSENKIKVKVYAVNLLNSASSAKLIKDLIKDAI